MKKSLLTLGACLAVAAGASAQGSLNINTPSSGAGFNTISSSASAGSGWYSGNLTITLWTIAASGNSTVVSTINSDAASAATEQAAISLITGSFTQQAFGTSTEALSQSLLVTGGNWGAGAPGVYSVGTAGTLSGSTDIYYALIAENSAGTLEGGLVLNGEAGYLPGAPSPGQPTQMSSIWPSTQNVLLAPVPEPTTLALAGLGGLSMLFLRRRKA